MANAAGQLPARAAALDAAIQADAVATIISEGVERRSTKCGRCIAAIDTLATQLPAALTGGGREPADAAAFAGQFAERLFSIAVVRFLEDRHAMALGALGLGGITDRMTLPNVGGRGHAPRAGCVSTASAR